MTHKDIRHENLGVERPATSASTAASGETTKKALHYGAALPLAAVMTIGLTLSMAGLIATEFTPQDKSEALSYEINPQVVDLPDPKRRQAPDPLKEVETPPPPPTVAAYKTAKVEPPHRELKGKKVIFEPTEIIMEGLSKGINIDKENPTPLVRIPPVFPPRFLQGNESGYCRVRFDVSPEGLPFNVETTVCTSKQLKSATVKSVQNWKYNPKVLNGRAVSRSGLETTIRFDLNDDRGARLPLPNGY